MMAKLHNAKDDQGVTSYVVEVQSTEFPSARTTWMDAQSERLRRDIDGALYGEISGKRYLLCEDLLAVRAK